MLYLCTCTLRISFSYSKNKLSSDEAPPLSRDIRVQGEHKQKQTLSLAASISTSHKNSRKLLSILLLIFWVTSMSFFILTRFFFHTILFGGEPILRLDLAWWKAMDEINGVINETGWRPFTQAWRLRFWSSLRLQTFSCFCTHYPTLRYPCSIIIIFWQSLGLYCRYGFC